MPSMLIVKGLPASVTVIVKEVGGTGPVLLTVGDTAFAYFVDKDLKTSIGNPISLSISDEQNLASGSFNLVINATSTDPADTYTSKFPYVSKFAEDGSKAKATCKCLIDFNIANLPADSKALLYEVYVEDVGL